MKSMSARTALLAVACSGLFLSVATSATPPDWRWPAFPAGVSPPAVPADNAMSAAKVALGRRLFYDPALSRNNGLSCADCHQQARGFTDGLTTHPGVMGDMGVRNVPGLANVGWRTALTWTDAGLDTLEKQAMVPMTGEHPVEMGMKDGEAEVARRLGADPCYRALFAKAFAGDRTIDFARVTAALGAFQRTMIAFDSPHDRFARGQATAITAQAQRGAARFAQAGCAACHSGADFTDGRTHYVGTAAPGEPDASAYGGKPPPPGFEPPVEQFRTPSLRNVAVTGPWLHDGRAPTMEDAIRRHAAPALLGMDMPALLAFLDSLTDRQFLKAAHLARPGKTCPAPSGTPSRTGDPRISMLAKRPGRTKD
jgi:cytochrome c peroxidase